MFGMIRRNGLLVARELRKRGYNVVVQVGPDQIEMIQSCFPNANLPHWVWVYDVKGVGICKGIYYRLRFLWCIFSADIIFSRCLGALRHVKLLHFLRKKLVEQSVGSDMRELPFGDEAVANLVRHYYRSVDKVFVSQSDHLALSDILGLGNSVFLPLAADSEDYFPGPPEFSFDGYDVVLFHPARHDWTYARGDRSPEKGNHCYRDSCKGNDKLIHACAALKDKGYNILLIMLNRGIDSASSRALVSNLGLEAHVVWKGDMTAKELCQYFRSADIVVDQFDLGTMGLVALDAMMCEVPVMTYIDEVTGRRAYGEMPPVMNCKTVEEIERTIEHYIANRKLYDEQGKTARKWVRKHHSIDRMIDTLSRELRDIK